VAGLNLRKLWRFREMGGSPPPAALQLLPVWDPEGVAYHAEPGCPDWPERWADFGDDAASVALLNQGEELGYVERKGEILWLNWSALFAWLAAEEVDLLAGDERLSLLKLPPLTDLRPALNSQDSLEDLDFRITLGVWAHPSGNRLNQAPILTGAVVTTADGERLLVESVWRLVEAVRQFYAQPVTERSAETNRQAWSRIRRLALAAGAPLEDFLRHTVVLTPDKLSLILRPSRDHGGKTLQVEPGFTDAPARWLETFDRLPTIPGRYDIPDAEGIVQVLVTPEVRAVLQEIRRWPGRYVAGQRAEAFVRNPYATLGEAASTVIDPDQFEQAREAAGIAFERFSVVTERDTAGALTGVGLLIESASTHDIHATRENFENTEALGRFVEHFARRVQKGHQCFIWEGYELEILGDVEQQLAELSALLNEWRKPAVTLRYEEVFDLGRYSDRIEGFGTETTYVSPFIARQDEEAGWIPDNVVFGVLFTPEGQDTPVGVVLDAEDQAALRQAVDQAAQAGLATVNIPGVDHPVNLAEARRLIEMLETTQAQVQQGAFDPDQRNPTHRSLILKSNIHTVDYRESRAEALKLPGEGEPLLPQALRHTVALIQHQRLGVAWLQHLWSHVPAHCRGALLADDMGLGKTLQILTFVLRCLEDDPALDPVLIVAPVSLLENWREELDKFFLPDAITVLTLYGQALAGKKLAKAEIDPHLLEEGVARFLAPDWLGAARLVLTTYETLRDLEFSLAAQHWSIMICDEAQKIKNPNALVTRAAKKQNVRFKIACTGTPVENSLADLWCLFDFIQPGLLGALNDFGTRYRRPIEARTEEEKARVEELRALIEPQILRRTKAQVAKDLPRKIEAPDCKNLPLSAYQRELYAHAVRTYRAQSGEGPLRNHLGLIQYLRQLCSSPYPLGQRTPAVDDLHDRETKSPKLKWLLGVLAEIRQRQEKAIVFVEFLDLQRQLQRYIQERFGYSPDIINGSTSAAASAVNSRQKRIRTFQNQTGFGVIILSPLAVGFGVNIQAANHVIHYTRTWSPAKEDQATDRAYRIGQTRDVTVYYPVITADFVTFDMKLDRLMDWKRGLSDDMLNGCGDLATSDFADLGAPEGGEVFADAPLDLHDIAQFDGKTFECLIAVVLAKQGYPLIYRTPDQGDAGVDVVAIRESKGLLVQCKTSLTSTSGLGWEAVKDVVAGTAFYELKHPGVSFTRIAATHHWFNQTAMGHAEINGVVLWDAETLKSLLSAYPITRFEVESLIAT
jgi:hypothetical protein